ncbi:MAG: DUF499 domain-containing protein, partial [Phycisphaerales bacterium]|nr:DUF499 domain-containing protein [Phycisphaerales bacterium]
MTTRQRKLKPWHQVATPHRDIVTGALDMATYAADLGGVQRGDGSVPTVYLDPAAFFEQTYPTAELRRLLEDVMRVLAGGSGDQVLQLRTPFGGGKTHTLLALYHLARGRDRIGRRDELAGIPDPGPVRVAVLSGVDLDPSLPRRHDGLVANTPWGELALQLGGADAFGHVRGQDELRQAPGRDALAPALGEGPVLILMDEVMQYIQRAGAISVGGGTLAQQTLTFMQTLTETVRARPGTALVYSLQASVQEAAGDETRLRMLEHLVGRMEAVREPVSGDEVMRVVQRRLFSDLGDPAERERVAAAYAQAHEAIRQATATGDDERRRAVQEAQE